MARQEDKKAAAVEPERLTKLEVRELTKLRRRYGWQPSGFTQKKVQPKANELIDDAESSPRL